MYISCRYIRLRLFLLGSIRLRWCKNLVYLLGHCLYYTAYLICFSSKCIIINRCLSRLLLHTYNIYLVYVSISVISILFAIRNKYIKKILDSNNETEIIKNRMEQTYKNTWRILLGKKYLITIDASLFCVCHWI